MLTWLYRLHFGVIIPDTCLTQVRAEVKEANPEASMTDMSKLIGAKWKDLSAEEKAPCVNSLI